MGRTEIIGPMGTWGTIGTGKSNNRQKFKH